MEYEREHIYFQLYNQRVGDFPVFQDARYIQYGNGLVTFCGVFFVMSYLWLSKVQRHFWEPLCRNGRKDKIGETQQNNQFSLLLAQFWMKGPRGWNKREVGKRKGKNWGPRDYVRQHPDQKKRKHSNSEADSDFYLEDERKKSIKYNFLMEGLLSELDYFEPNVTQLLVMGN